jgi:hypothetical protein
MTGLGEAYRNANGPGRLRVWTGIGLFAGGVIAVIAAILIGTLGVESLSTFAERRAAGTLAGLGTPIAFLGVLAVLPASRRIYAAAIVGTAVAILGVALFWDVYSSPFWAGTNGHRSLRHLVAAVYATGALTTAASLFTGLATTEARRRPGGTARLAVTEQGRLRLVDATPNLRDRLTATMSDGGTVSEPVVGDLDDAVVWEQTPEPEEPALPDDADPYCGNCEYFHYERAGEDLQPFCEFRNERMADMEACDEWSLNRSGDVARDVTE